MNRRPLVTIIISLLFALFCLVLNFIYPRLTIIAYLAVVFSLIPYYVSIGKALIKKQLDLSLPPIITIFLLLYLGKNNVALIFIFIILLGNLFKEFILERVKASITNISDKLPKIAIVKINNQDTEILIKDIRIDDLLIVKSGERVATDAILLNDEGLIDESVVTGESAPVSKKRAINCWPVP